MKKLVLFISITLLLLGCTSEPTTPDVNAISTQAVATAYADLTQSPQSTSEPPLFIRALENMHLTELVWSPDGQAIAASACQETCQLNLYTLDLTQIWSMNVAGTISYLDYSLDGKLLAALVQNGIRSKNANGKILEADQTEIWLFNAQDGDFLRKWDVEQAVMLRFEPSGKRIATAGESVILWDINTGTEFWKLSSNEVHVAEKPSSVKLASLSWHPSYGGGPSGYCGIETFDTVSFSQVEPALIVSGYGLGFTKSSTSASEYIKCYAVQARYMLYNRPGDELIIFSTEQFPDPHKLALQIIADSTNSNSISSLLVMSSGFYPYNLNFSSPGTTQSETSVAEPETLENWGLDFSSLTMIGAAISPSAERAAVWGKTPDNSPTYFLSLFDARTSQKIAEIQIVSDPALSPFATAFSPDGRILAVIDQSGDLKLWQVGKILP